MPGVSFDLPKSWVSCDDATDKLLGNNPDAHNFRSNICNVSTEYKFRGFNPILFRTMSMLIEQHEKQDISAQDLDAITPDVATTISPQVCKTVVEPLTKDGATVDSCEMTVGTFAGHKALHSIVIAVPPSGKPEYKYQIDIFELPYSQGYLQVQFNSPVMFKPTTKPEMDSIIASFKIE